MRKVDLQPVSNNLIYSLFAFTQAFGIFKLLNVIVLCTMTIKVLNSTQCGHPGLPWK